MNSNILQSPAPQKNTETPSSPTGTSQSDTKEIVFLASGLLALVVGIGGLLMYSENEPVRATASQGKDRVRITSSAHMAAGFDGTNPQPTLSDPITPSQATAEETMLPQPMTEPGVTIPLEGTDVYFAFDRWTLSGEAQEAIRTQFENRPDAWTGTLRIVGHTDARGPDAYNRTLGLKRAESVKAYLITLGIPEEDIHVETLGKDGPVCQEETPSCFEHNRRAHVAFVPAALSDEEALHVSMTPGPLNATTSEEAAPSADDLNTVPSNQEVAGQEEVREDVVITAPLIAAESLH
jgi:peptidoglycan-associated lipoprotein